MVRAADELDGHRAAGVLHRAADRLTALAPEHTSGTVTLAAELREVAGPRPPDPVPSQPAAELEVVGW